MESERSVNREFDVIVWGATGYMGKLVSEHLWQNYGATKNLRWAIAGRNEGKLEAVRSSFGKGSEQVGLIVADSHDAAKLDAICKRTRVICSTVGPYLIHGEALVAACIENDTDYCDLTGEYIWMRQMLDKHEARAQKSRARIVYSCGFDSLPSDLGTLFLENEMRQRFGEYATEIKMRIMHGFSAESGSGGTMASISNSFELVFNDKKLWKLVLDPDALLSGNAQQKPVDRDIKFPRYEKEIKSWVAPYLMAAGNTKIVRRTNELMDYRYGDDFRYGEGICTGSGLKGWWRATKATFVLYLFLVFFSIGPIRRRIQRTFPKPGEGISREERESSNYRIIFTAVPAGNARNPLQAEIQGNRDMGYGSSSRMIAETAVCLALDLPTSDKPGGMWTPASCLGNRLIERLEKNAEIQFSILSASD